MKIGNPNYGSFRVVDGVKFTFTRHSDPNFSPRLDYWDAGALAHRVYTDGISAPYRVGNGNVYSSLDRAMRAAVKYRRAEVNQARELVARYDAANVSAGEGV